jgi:hypothetical protein
LFYKLNMDNTTTTSNLIKVKFLFRGNRKNKKEIWLRQFPSNSPIWDNCEFIFDETCNTYDWLVVYDDLSPLQNERFSKRQEQLRCHQKNTLLITSEPSNIKVYGSKYVNQFGHVLTTHEPWVINHKNAIYSQCGYRWFYGVGNTQLKGWDDISKNIPMHKTKTISTMCSDKRQRNTVHAQRYDFTQKLKEEIPELEVFGHGVRLVDDKADAIDTYKYHVVIENVSQKDHWSEKLADAFLGNALPIYYGCTNIQDYFSPKSFIAIDPYDEDRSIQIIKDAIQSNEYDNRVEAIRESRELVLKKYNFFAVVTDIINSEHCPKQNVDCKPTVIKSRHAIRHANPINFIHYFIERYYVKIRHLVSNNG